MGLFKFAVKRAVTVAMIFLCIILLGVVALQRLSIDLFPEINLPMAAVMTTYPGAGSEEVESDVTEPLEEILGTVQGVDSITSISSPSSSMVLVTFNLGMDMDFASLQMREKIDMVKGSLPDDVQSPMIYKMDPNMMPLAVIGVNGGTNLAELKTYTEDTLKPRLERQEGVASVSLMGGFDNELHVIVDPARLNAYGLSLDSVAQAINYANLDMSAGSVISGDKELTVRALGSYTSIDDIRNVPINLNNGSVIYLADVAEVVQAESDEDYVVRIDGKPAIALSVMKQSDSNTVQVANQITAALDQLNTETEKDFQSTIVMNQADFIMMAIDSLLNSLIVGAVLAMIILFLFLRSVRSTLIIALSIPISLLGTVMVLYFQGLSLNMMTLGGLVLGVGMMVDSSIVILEGIYRNCELGMHPHDAAVKGASQLALAVIASTLTTVAVFLPISFVEGISSMLFKEMALTVTISLLSSLVVALILVPMLCSRLLRVDNDVKEQRNSFMRGVDWCKNIMGKFLTSLDNGYRRLLLWALRRRKTVLLVVILLFVASVALIPAVGMEFIPASDSGQISITIEMPEGTSIEATNEMTEEVETIIGDLNGDLESFYSIIGSGGMSMSSSATTNMAQISLQLIPVEERALDVKAEAELVRQMLANIPGATITVAATDATGMSMMSGGSAITVEIKGNDLDMLEQLSEQVKTAMEGVEGTRSVTSSVDDQRPEIQLSINRTKAAQYGLGIAQIASSVRTAFDGEVATTYHPGGTGEDMDIRVVLPDGYANTTEKLRYLNILSPAGMAVPLLEVVDIEEGYGPISISRSDQTRYVSVSCDYVGRDLASVTDDIQAAVNNIPLPQDYTIELSGQSTEMMEAFSDLGLAMVLAIILVYMVMAALFESFSYPFIIMFSLPTTLIGVILALVIGHNTLNVISLIGMIMLVGIVVNNAIVLVDCINQFRADGMERNEAIFHAGPIRLRPILMTTLTTVLAMLPMAFASGDGAELSAPLATVVAGGLAVSTLFTLILVPVMYTLFDDAGRKFRSLFKKKKSSGEMKEA